MLDCLFQNVESLSSGGQIIFFLGIFVVIIFLFLILLFILIWLDEKEERLQNIEKDIKNLKKKVGGKK